MGDLISRGAALNKVLGHCWFCRVPLRGAPCGGCIVDTISGEIKNLPTVDAEPVRHERWAHLGGDEWCCTGCGEVIHTEGSWEQPTKKFCHECGAKMDKEGEK